MSINPALSGPATVAVIAASDGWIIAVRRGTIEASTLVGSDPFDALSAEIGDTITVTRETELTTV